MLSLLTPSLLLALPNEITQEGFLMDADGRPLEGAHDIRVRLYAVAQAGEVLFDETHLGVQLTSGYYSIAIGSLSEIDPSHFERPALYLGFSIDNEPEFSPRTAFNKMPAAFIADVATNATGDITPNSVSVGGGVVINAGGQWVGDPSGLVGPVGPIGPQGERGIAGPAGPAGGDADPVDVVPLVVQELQADPSALPFIRSDADDSSAGTLTMNGNLLFNENPLRDSLIMNNNNATGFNALSFNDPGANEGLSWAGSQAKIFVSPLNDANSDGFLRFINDDGISLESAVRIAGDLLITGGITGVQSIIATLAEITTAEIINANISNLNGPNGQVEVLGNLQLHSDIKLSDATEFIGTLRAGIIQAAGALSTGGALSAVGNISAGGNIEAGANSLIRAGDGGFYVKDTRVFDGNGNLLTRPLYQCPDGQIMAGTLDSGLPRCVSLSCANGQVFTGLDNNLNPVCISNGLTALPANQCPAGQAIVSIDGVGGSSCGAVGVSAQRCHNGEVMVGITADGQIICALSTIEPSCKAILDAAPGSQNGDYQIDPNGGDTDDSITVFCDMDGGGWTQINHDREARTHRINCEPQGCHDIPVTYPYPMDQITALIDNGSCKQYLLWECYGSGLWTGGNNYGFFYGRGNQESYWPGGTADCDLNDNVWRQSGGDVTIGSDLPVTRMRFGDTTDPENGFHTLGKLLCR